jgi:hypothetical protein
MFRETIVALFMHNIPSMVMIVILVIAWKRENIAEMLLVLCALGFGVLLGMKGRLMGHPNYVSHSYFHRYSF